jgi:hypothetical protein
MAHSILQTDKVCYITGQTNNLHKHHIYFGNPLRSISEENGFWVYLCGRLHNQSADGVHGMNGRELDMMLKQHCQMKYEETHSREEFMKLIGRNYLD